MAAMDWSRKTEIRHWGLNLRDSISSESRVSKQYAIFQSLSQIIESKAIQTLGVYSAFRGEVDIDWKLLNCQLAFPRIAKNNSMDFHIASSDGPAFQQNQWGILEPIPESCPKVPTHDLSAIIVPGVVFNHQGNRVGYGKGFYDRVLDGFCGLKIGVAFQEQVINSNMFTEEHDQTMDYLVTDDFVLRPVIQNEKRLSSCK